MPYAFNDDKSKYDLSDLTNNEADFHLNLSGIVNQISSSVKDDILGQVFPVGSVYISADPDFDPNTDIDITGAVWVKIEDRVLLGTGETFGSTPGTESTSENSNLNGTLMLNDNQVPLRNHKHLAGSLVHNHTHLENNHVFTARYTDQTKINGVAIHTYTAHKKYADQDVTECIYNMNRGRTGANRVPSKMLSTEGPSNTAVTGETAEKNLARTASVNIMPPYILVDLWRRTE